MRTLHEQLTYRYVRGDGSVSELFMVLLVRLSACAAACGEPGIRLYSAIARTSFDAGLADAAGWHSSVTVEREPGTADAAAAAAAAAAAVVAGTGCNRWRGGDEEAMGREHGMCGGGGKSRW